MNSDRFEALKIHQKARSKVSVASLSWDRGLTDDAQRYANQLASLDQGMQHSRNLLQQGQGENLASCSGDWSNPCTEASKLWYAEKKHWKGGVVQAQGMEAVGHYTQMVWSPTTHVGMAVAIAPSGTTYVVARYSPAGNLVGQAPDDVSKASDAAIPSQGTSRDRSGNKPNRSSSVSKYGGSGHYPGQRPMGPSHQHRRHSIPGPRPPCRHPSHVVDPGSGPWWALWEHDRNSLIDPKSMFVHPNGPFPLTTQPHYPRDSEISIGCCVIL